MSNFKIHPKHMMWLMPLILSGIMSGSISCFNMLLNKGFVDGFFSLWLHAWSLSWLMAFPLIMIFLPLVRKFLMQFVDQPKC
jgi:phosphotransferase system  glucose/maltose/N-acetylglucosamine-specific IIC component